MQKKTAKHAKHTNDSVWETLAQRRKLARICAPFKAYTGECAWKATGYRLQGPCYRSRDDYDRKIRSRKARLKANRIVLWNSKIHGYVPENLSLNPIMD